MKLIKTISILLLLSVHVSAQFYHQEVFPSLQGPSLSEALISEFKPSNVLDDSDMKDTLMAVIYLEDDHVVRGVYSSYPKPLDPNSPDPNQDVFDNGAPTGLNVEHIYPRNKGAKFFRAATDMHHLAPAKVNINGDRGNLPFGEINDNQTDRWYRLGEERSSTPNSNIDEYSEWINTRFEPKEDFKGNVARAMFYFYTMYQDFADGEDPLFFDAQRETLCSWHFADPVDSMEWDRTFKIAHFQDGRANPFVLDCSVAARLYCQDISQECQMTVPTAELQVVNQQDLLIYPNPSNGPITISATTLAPTDRILITDLMGRLVYNEFTQDNPSIQVRLEAGIYFISVLTDSGIHLNPQKVIIH